MRLLKSIELWINAAIWIVGLVLIELAVAAFLGAFEFPYQSLVSSALGLMAWAFIVSWSVNRTLIYVNFQKARIGMNMFNGETKTLFAGWNMIYVWEELQEQEFDLVKRELVEEHGTETYTSLDSVVLFAKWTMVISPDPKNLKVFAGFDWKTIVAQFRAHTNQVLSDECGRRLASDTTTNKAVLSAIVAKAFGGAKQSDLELKYGVTVSDPELADIDQDPAVLKAKQIGVDTEVFANAVKNLMQIARDNNDNSLTLQEAKNTVLMIMKTPGVEFKLYDLKVNGLEQLQHLAWGGLHGVGGGGKGQNPGGGKKPRGGQQQQQQAKP
ncbi:MAG: hypothetical protein WC763_01375 [Candidatus Paceibacterota bacterium]|jgi:hypothetical protein